MTLHFDNGHFQHGKLAIGCDGIHSAVRKQLFPDEGPPKYSGVNMWRGVGALAGLPRRRHHGLDGLDDGRQDGDLSDPPGHARRPAASR